MSIRFDEWTTPLWISILLRRGQRGEVEEIGGRRQPKLLFSTLFWKAEYRQVPRDLWFHTYLLNHSSSSSLLHDSSPTSYKACKTQWPRKQLSWPTSKRRWQLWQGAYHVALRVLRNISQWIKWSCWCFGWLSELWHCATNVPCDLQVALQDNFEDLDWPL